MAEKVRWHYPDLTTEALKHTLAYPPGMINHVCTSLQTLGLCSRPLPEGGGLTS